MNVCSGGELPLIRNDNSLDHDLITGKRDPSSLFDAMLDFACGNDIMLTLLQEEDNKDSTSTNNNHYNNVYVSTHPGHLRTELHNGQGLIFDVIERIVTFFTGISIETAGIRQASILATVKPKQPKAGGSSSSSSSSSKQQQVQQQLHWSYVSQDMKGRLMATKLKDLIDAESTWLLNLLHELISK